MTSSTPVQRYPVGSFDHFFLNDDSEEFPTHFFVRATFDGLFDHGLFEQAVAHAVERHPLLRSALVGRPTKSRRALAYVPSADTPYLRWARVGEGCAHPDGRVRIDLTREHGFRLFVHESDRTSVLVLQCHHAVVDGAGSLMFLDDILAVYEHLESPGPGTPRLRPLNPDKLRDRDTFHLTPEHLRARRRIDMAEGVRLASAMPHPIFGGARTMKTGQMPAPTAVWREFDRDAFGRIRTAAKARGGTVNDFLLWNLFRAVAAWNRAHEPGVSPSLRIGLPVNLRQPGDADIPACNIVGLYLLDRDGAQIEDGPGLYASILSEMERMKRDLLGFVFVHLARVMGSIPFGLAALLLPKPFGYNCVETIALSNLGLALNGSPMMHEDGTLRAGSLTLTRCELLPPTRFMTHGAIGVVSYGGRMAMTLNYDPRFLEEQKADELLQAYVSQILDATGS